jgi:hypothetical protein
MGSMRLSSFISNGAGGRYGSGVTSPRGSISSAHHHQHHSRMSANGTSRSAAQQESSTFDPGSRPMSPDAEQDERPSTLIQRIMAGLSALVAATSPVASFASRTEEGDNRSSDARGVPGAAVQERSDQPGSQVTPLHGLQHVVGPDHAFLAAHRASMSSRGTNSRVMSRATSAERRGLTLPAVAAAAAPLPAEEHPDDVSDVWEEDEDFWPTDRHVVTPPPPAAVWREDEEQERQGMDSGLTPRQRLLAPSRPGTAGSGRAATPEISAGFSLTAAAAEETSFSRPGSAAATAGGTFRPYFSAAPLHAQWPRHHTEPGPQGVGGSREGAALPLRDAPSPAGFPPRHPAAMTARATINLEPVMRPLPPVPALPRKRGSTKRQQAGHGDPAGGGAVTVGSSTSVATSITVAGGLQHLSTSGTNSLPGIAPGSMVSRANTESSSTGLTQSLLRPPALIMRTQASSSAASPSLLTQRFSAAGTPLPAGAGVVPDEVQEDRDSRPTTASTATASDDGTLEMLRAVQRTANVIAQRAPGPGSQAVPGPHGTTTAPSYHDGGGATDLVGDAAGSAVLQAVEMCSSVLHASRATFARPYCWGLCL